MVATYACMYDNIIKVTCNYRYVNTIEQTLCTVVFDNSNNKLMNNGLVIFTIANTCDIFKIKPTWFMD